MEPEPHPTAISLISFFVLAYLFAWIIWIPAGLVWPGATGPVLLGAWAPTLAALVVVSRDEGRVATRRLLGRLVRWRAPATTYVAAVLGPIAVVLAALGLHALAGGDLSDLGAVGARFGLPAERPGLFLLASPLIYLSTIFVGGPIAEELGWRGFAQPRLSTRLGVGPASLVIGFLWSLWHLPLFVFAPAAVGGVPLVLYIPLVTALGVLFAWVLGRSGGSVLPCILLHAGVNFSLGVVGLDALAQRPLVIFAAIIGLLAIAAFVRLPRPSTRT